MMNQILKEIMLILTDSRSKDDTPMIFNNMRGEDDWTLVIYQKGKKSAAGCNLGMDTACWE